eukprot:gnl/MRDRNA2_/MRDRNA2_19918_c0_seq1.p1 gnl/MRDRNA2_/MRDRNA2_19918_c0~~gnl/MRDRNA2_/MRDRNA2_19918_c0_seq1.p1  ORF type:complete len:762 (+),score=132.94 gnl/MRDRNA2_/MRDRNA2_19918_c0_seq1:165-2450(+)
MPKKLGRTSTTVGAIKTVQPSITRCSTTAVIPVESYDGQLSGTDPGTSGTDSTPINPPVRDVATIRAVYQRTRVSFRTSFIEFKQKSTQRFKVVSAQVFDNIKKVRWARAAISRMQAKMNLRKMRTLWFEREASLRKGPMDTFDLDQVLAELTAHWATVSHSRKILDTEEETWERRLKRTLDLILEVHGSQARMDALQESMKSANAAVTMDVRACMGMMRQAEELAQQLMMNEEVSALINLRRWQPLTALDEQVLVSKVALLHAEVARCNAVDLSTSPLLDRLENPSATGTSALRAKHSTDSSVSFEEMSEALGIQDSADADLAAFSRFQKATEEAEAKADKEVVQTSSGPICADTVLVLPAEACNPQAPLVSSAEACNPEPKTCDVTPTTSGTNLKADVLTQKHRSRSSHLNALAQPRSRQHSPATTPALPPDHVTETCIQHPTAVCAPVREKSTQAKMQSDPDHLHTLAQPKKEATPASTAKASDPFCRTDDTESPHRPVSPTALNIGRAVSPKPEGSKKLEEGANFQSIGETSLAPKSQQAVTAQSAMLVSISSAHCEHVHARPPSASARPGSATARPGSATARPPSATARPPPAGTTSMPADVRAASPRSCHSPTPAGHLDAHKRHMQTGKLILGNAHCRSASKSSTSQENTTDGRSAVKGLGGGHHEEVRHHPGTAKRVVPPSARHTDGSGEPICWLEYQDEPMDKAKSDTRNNLNAPGEWTQNNSGRRVSGHDLGHSLVESHLHHRDQPKKYDSV